MIDKAANWISENSIQNQGIIVNSRQRTPYPEVSGYFIPTLLSLVKINLARQYSQWLISIQNSDGSFSGPNGNNKYVFDTAQVIRGWVAIVDLMPELISPIRKACDWVISTADPSTGRLLTPSFGGDWSLGRRGEVNEGIHLYALSPILSVAEKFNDSKLRKFVQKSLNHYLKYVQLTDFTLPNSLTHFYGYIQDSLFDLGLYDLAFNGMSSVAKYQQSSGAVPGYSDVNWVCSTGLAQLAIVWYKLGDLSRADASINFLQKLQNPSGGFMGSYGIEANYFPSSEISWAVKYYIDASHLQISKHFDSTVNQYSSHIDKNDGRVKAIIAHLGDLNCKNILDAGCGKGSYSVILKNLYPTSNITAVDISEKMLSYVPNNITKIQSSLLNIPLPNSTFDAIICIEALEHTVDISRAISELCRNLSFDGTLIIIDKNKCFKGTLEMPNWEKWFDLEEVTALLQIQGLFVKTEFISYDNHTEPDGLFICWVAKKIN